MPWLRPVRTSLENNHGTTYVMVLQRGTAVWMLARKPGGRRKLRRGRPLSVASIMRTPTTSCPSVQLAPSMGKRERSSVQQR